MPHGRWATFTGDAFRDFDSLGENETDGLAGFIAHIVVLLIFLAFLLVINYLDKSSSVVSETISRL